ncbi:MAG: hypothetical protein ACI84K_000632 [Pseudohongiellaceae bacterium]|jgi:uncharacterized protein (TIGR03546 family)
MLTILAKLLQNLNSNQNPNQLALAVCFGLAVGLMPGFSLFLVILLILVCLIKANISMFLFIWGLFEAIAYVADPALHQIGYSLLTTESLQTIWVSLSQSSFWILTAFNNSLVMGSTVSILILWLPVYFMVRLLIRHYRDQIQGVFKELRIMQILKGSKFYHVYQTVGN